MARLKQNIGGNIRPPCETHDQLEPMGPLLASVQVEYDKLADTARSKEDVTRVGEAFKNKRVPLEKLKVSVSKAIKDLGCYWDQKKSCWERGQGQCQCRSRAGPKKATN